MRILSTLLIGALLMTACSSNPTRESAGEGAGIGAIAGAVICVLGRLHHDQCVAVMGLGAALGAGVGYSLAKDIENRQKQLSGKENDLDARLQYVGGLNVDVAKFNSKLSDQIRAAQAKIGEKQASQEQLANMRNELDNQVSHANQELQAADHALAELKQFRAQRPDRPSSTLDTEIDKYEQLLVQCRTDTLALASVRQRI